MDRPLKASQPATYLYSKCFFSFLAIHQRSKRESGITVLFTKRRSIIIIFREKLREHNTDSGLGRELGAVLARPGKPHVLYCNVISSESGCSVTLSRRECHRLTRTRLTVNGTRGVEMSDQERSSGRNSGIDYCAKGAR